MRRPTAVRTDGRWSPGWLAATTLAATLCSCAGRIRTQPAGDTAPTETASCDRNPYGACYPTDDLGTSPLVLSSSGDVVRRGERLANLRFLGFRATSADAVVDSSHAEVVSLSDFYDPDQRLGPDGGGFTVIHIMANAAWCGPSNVEADFVSGGDYSNANTAGASFAKELEPLGVVFLEVLVDGQVTGKAATVTDLQKWVTNHGDDYTTVLDVGGWYDSVLGSYYPAAAIPFNLDIDARSMEILDASIGFGTQLDVSVVKWLMWERSHAPL